VKSRTFFQSILFFLTASLPAHSASLPSGLIRAEIEQLIERVGFQSTTRLLRGAEAYPPWPGVRFGVDVSLASQMDFSALGDKNGSEPKIYVLPRFHFVKGLWGNVEIIFSTLPITNQPGYSATGGILKWSFYREAAGWLSVSAFAGYTYVSAFRGDYTGNNFEFGLYASKDYVRLKPYLGASVLLAQGGVRPALAKTAAVSSMKGTLHVFIGIELEYPVTIAGELGLFNLNPSFSILIGKHF
jgi:hypothetical protein